MAVPAAPDNFRIATYVLSVDDDVSGLQFDISKDLQPSLVVSGTMTFEFTTIDATWDRVLVWVTAVETFTDQFMYLTGASPSIQNVIASDIDGNEIEGVNVTSEAT